MSHAPVEEGCLGEEAITEFLLGGVMAPGAEAIQAHMSRCASCRRLMSALTVAGCAASPPGADSVSPTLQLGSLGSLGSGPRAIGLPIGARIGRYVVVDWLGAGGMGVVYAAYDPELDRKVALKLLRSDGVGSAHRRPTHDQLVHEAQAMARLVHPNVVTVFDVGSFDDRVFIAMELVEGQTLAQWLSAERRARSEIVAAFLAAGCGLAAAHAAGLVHRDFKPDNVLIGSDGRVCVTDFGLARASVVGSAEVVAPGAEQPGHGAGTEPTSVAGTLAYMAPEQHLGRRADSRADQFSFAVALHEALYGERPAAAAQRTDGDGPAPGLAAWPRRDHGVPTPLRRALRRALSFRPEDRYPSMAALLAALEPRRRWGHLVASGAVLVVVAAIAVAGAYAIHLRHSADQRTEVVGRLRSLAPELRTMLRSAHMLPAHDIRAVREQLRLTIRDVSQQLTTCSEQDECALGDFVLGEARRALGEHERALVLLEAAWTGGQRGPDIDAALGHELGVAYESRLGQLEHTVQSARREVQIRAIEQRYRDPAMAHLRAALAARTGSPAYLQALIAFHDHHLADSSRSAQAAFAEAPTFYEAGMLEAKARSELGHQLVAAGERDAASAEFAASRQIFDRVLEIARSDDEAWLAYGKMVYLQANELASAGEMPPELLHTAVTALRTAAQINPENGEPFLREAEIELGQGNIDVILRRDPTPHVDSALAAVEAARAHDADAIEADMEACVAYWERGAYQSTHGIDPHDAFAQAIAACERAAAVKPDADKYSTLGTVYSTVAAYDGDHGRDPTRGFELGEHNLRASLAIEDDRQVHYNLGRLWTKLAQYQGSHGLDPQRAVDSALAEYQTTVQMSKVRADAWDGRSDALAVRAQRALDDGDDPRPTLALARAALERAHAIDASFVPAIRSRIVIAEIEAEALLARGVDPSPVLARVDADLQPLQRSSPDDGVAHRTRCVAELIAARWALGRRDAVSPRLSRAAAAAARARDRDAMDAAAWTESAAVELVRAEAARARRGGHAAEAIASGRVFVERALAIDPRRTRTQQVRDQLARLAAAAE